MTLVHIDLRGPDGTPATGSLLFSPTKRLEAADHIILPKSFEAELVEGVADAELLPTSVDWAWSVIERTKSGIRRYVAVADSPTTVNYKDLVDVDPATLIPADPPSAVSMLDSTVSALVTDTGSATATALSATYAPRRDQGQAAVAALESGYPDVRIGLAGDSTGDATDEWFHQLGDLIADEFPGLAIDYEDWDDTTQANIGSTIQAGGGPTYSYRATRRDYFHRTVADIVGTPTEVGATNWTVTGADGNGNWTADGTSAVAAAHTTRAPILVSTGQAGSSRTKWTYEFVATGAHQVDFFIRRASDSNRLFVTLARDASNNIYTSLSKRVSSVTTSLANIPNTPIVVGGTYVIEVEVIVSGSGSASVSATINGTTLTGNLSASDWTAVNAGFNQGLYVVSGTPTGDRWHLFEFGFVDEVYPQQTLTLYNGSLSGSTLDYQIGRVAAQFPDPLDVLVISSSHNYTTMTEADYITELEGYMAAVRAVHPDVTILLSSQNPEYAPMTAARITAHLKRMRALRQYAEANLYGYIPVTEVWQAAGDPTLLIQNDGLHPTVGANSGSSLWAGVAFDHFAQFFRKIAP